MGLIKSILGFIGGIFKALVGLVGLGNRSEFYMELDEATADGPPVVAVSAPAPVTAEPKTKAAPVAAAAKAPAKAAPVVAAAAKAPAKPAPTPAASAVAAAPGPAGFASNYLNVGTTMPSRRRPGPSLSPFMDMAKQVKTR